MVYENTHLWAAEQIKSRIKNRIIEETIGNNLDYYHLGAIFPDVLFYSNDPSNKLKQLTFCTVKQGFPPMNSSSRFWIQSGIRMMKKIWRSSGVS